MHEYVKVMQTIENRFTSTNSVDVERTTIKRDEWVIVKAELSRLQAACHKLINDS